MGTATMQYIQDFDEVYPRGLQAISPDLTTSQQNEMLGTGAHFANNLWWGEILFPYYKSRQVMLCPSGIRYYQNNVYSGNYGTNTMILPTSASVSNVKLAQVPGAASVYLLMDAGVYNMNPSGNVGNPLVPDPLTSVGSNQYLPGTGEAGTTECVASTIPAQQNDCKSGRHFGGLNIAFADGHVKWIRSEVAMREYKKPFVPTGCGAAITCTQYAKGAWNFLSVN